jgi:phosphatidylinositol glycan class A protein
MTLADTQHVICVSHTAKENTILRSGYLLSDEPGLAPERVSVIPNAVDAKVFVPDVTQRNPDRITIVVASRLMYRKGMHLLAGVMPHVCAKYDNVDFLIAGDGSMREHLETVHRQGWVEEARDAFRRRASSQDSLCPSKG